MFKKYQKVARYGTTDVEGIEIGQCVIFPKIDGTNGSVWLENGEIKAGSRNRELSLEKDNAGFYAHILENEAIQSYLRKHPTHRLYGEWLVPHSLKTYRDDTWRKFYVFDVCEDVDDDVKYIPYNEYQGLLEEYGINYIPPLATVNNGSYEQFIPYLDKNDFLIRDGKGNGEGIVIKNYDFRNKFGRQVWAKIITSEFKEKHKKVMGDPDISNENIIEEKIVNDFCTEAFVEKEFAKFALENDGFQSTNIPELLGKIWYEFINEESWNIIKKYKNPKINYKILNGLVIKKIKEVKPELF